MKRKLEDYIRPNRKKIQQIISLEEQRDTIVSSLDYKKIKQIMTLTDERWFYTTDEVRYNFKTPTQKMIKTQVKDLLTMLINADKMRSTDDIQWPLYISRGGIACRLTNAEGIKYLEAAYQPDKCEFDYCMVSDAPDDDE